MKKFITSFLILLSILILGSCSSFFGDPEPLQIASITHEAMENGEIKITITYTDQTKLPDEFIIPKGEDGEAGVGIKDIITEKNDDERKTTLTITFTDETLEPTVVAIPDGLGVIGIETKYVEEENETYMIVNYSDGSKSAPLLLPKGDKGEDGNSISSYEVVTNDDLSTTITFHFTQSEDFVVNIPAPKKGNGIDSITSSETEDKYVLIIQYTDPEMGNQKIEFNKPAEPNKWLSGTSQPSLNEGDNGDYYFDTGHNDIYKKENGVWKKVVDFDDNEQIYNVTFNLNDTIDSPAQMPAGFNQISYEVKRGTYFTSEVNGYNQIPIPTRPGYEFLGWYQTKIITPVNAAFTDLTPVFQDITLYAIWKEI